MLGFAVLIAYSAESNIWTEKEGVGFVLEGFWTASMEKWKYSLASSEPELNLAAILTP